MISSVTVVAALTGPLPKLGVVVVAAFVAVALLSRGSRERALAMLGALVLAPLLLLADIWHSPQLGSVHRHPLIAVVVAVAGLAVVVIAARFIVRSPALLAPLAVVALPFRIPIQAGGSTSNLLVPLYLVVAAGSVAFIFIALRDGGDGADTAARPGWVERLLAAYVVLYAIQSVYSADFEKALQQLVFFYVPFALMFCLLRRLYWSKRLLRGCLELVVGLTLLFALVGFVEYATKTLLLNPKLVAANAVHSYFTVNSVFFDPDIFGRFLALVMILLAAILLYDRRQREQLGATAALGVLWAALVLTLSRSSLAALLLGLAALAAFRWNLSRALIPAVLVVAIGVAVVLITPNTFGLNQGLNGASSGRAGLVSGGLKLFGQRPLWGYGSGSFVVQYRKHHPQTTTTLAASHTIPITIAAEQGLIGELVYLALVIAAVVTLLRGARARPARVAVGAAFLALVFHTLLYADFLEDPVTWTLLGIGMALAVPARAPLASVTTPPKELAPIAA